MIDQTFVGWSIPAYTVNVEKGRLRFFVKVIGENNPIYFDKESAHVAGHHSLLAPPTYVFCLAMEQPVSQMMLDEMGVNIGRLLHWEQSFSYHLPIYAGDRITFESRVADIYEKKGGALEFIVRDTIVTNQDGGLVAELRSTLIIRN